MKAIIRIMLLAIVSLIASCADKDEPITQPEEPQPPEAKPNYQWKLVMESEPVQTIWSGVQQYAEFNVTLQAPDTLSSEAVCKLSIFDRETTFQLHLAGLYSNITPNHELGTSTVYNTHALTPYEMIILIDDEVQAYQEGVPVVLGGQNGLKKSFKVRVPSLYLGTPESPAQYCRQIIGALNIKEVSIGRQESIDMKPCLFMIQYFRPSVLINSTNFYYAECLTAVSENNEYIVNVPLKVFGHNPNPDGISLTVTCFASSKGVTVSVDKELEIPAGAREFKIPVRFDLSAVDVMGEYRASTKIRIVANGNQGDSETTPEIKSDTQTGTVALCITSPYRLNIDPAKASSNDMEQTEGSIANLMDDNPLSFFHSNWRRTVARSEPYGSYIDFELPVEINKLAIELTARGDKAPVSPKNVALYYSLTGEAGSWKELLMNHSLDLTQTSQKEWIGGIDENQWIVSAEKFRYLRFCALTNSKDESLCIPNPSNSHFWNLAEFHVFGQ